MILPGDIVTAHGVQDLHINSSYPAILLVLPHEHGSREGAVPQTRLPLQRRHQEREEKLI